MMESERKKRIKQRLYEQQNGKCAYCGARKRIGRMTLDHIIPLAQGGTDSAHNLQCTCKMCNRFKGCMLPNEFTAFIRRVLDNSMEVEKNVKKAVPSDIRLYLISYHRKNDYETGLYR